MKIWRIVLGWIPNIRVMSIYKTVHLNEEDSRVINDTLNDAMEYLANRPEQTYNHWLFHRIADVFELLNK